MTKSHSVLRRVCGSAAFVLLALLLLAAASVLLRPPQETYGSTWRAWRAEPPNSIDVLYLGSSCAYCDIDPVEIYRNSGLTGYVMGGSEQTMSLTYWYLRQCLETQKPQAVFLEATGVFFQRYQGYTQVNVAYMPFTLNRLGAICTAAEPELRPGLLLDLWFYHDRWKEPLELQLGPSDYKGFTPVEGTAEEIVLDSTPRDVAPEQYEENLSWLLRSLELCQEREIPAVVVVNPTYYHCDPEQYRRLGEDLAAAAPEAVFLDWSAAFGDLDLEPEEHLYDRAHLNRTGAAVYAKGLARFLTGALGLEPMAQTGENQAAWDAVLVRRDERFREKQP